MSNFMTKSAKYIAEKVYKNLAKGSGNMILITSMLGIAMSSVAQTAAILINKKYSVSQKAYMVPQELTEGCITILSIFLITKPIQKFSSRYVKSGKIVTKDIAEYMKKYNLTEKRGELNFDFKKSVQDIITKIEKSEKYIKSSSKEREKIVSEHKDIINKFDIMDDATSAIATTAGGILSTAIISPYLRNYSASHYQKVNLSYYDSIKRDYQNGQTDYNRLRMHRILHSNIGLSKI